ncbi:ABC transporter ATP-binding protein [Ktedonospora formicarum]|uniref:ABC transporter ATP-binding protein n=1 Tax=Ktedonospora formicarum TaxID=2778364 RepID=A0A8J3I786_9CHLR|nr:ABC transporter ATP-binding protein [Ktedonospora formicarum]GHO48135.1 hypothetical protein KSX_62980 [Ktedonospora formicarum]
MNRTEQENRTERVSRTERLKQFYQFMKLLVCGRRAALIAMLIVTAISVAAAFETPILIKEVGLAGTLKDAEVLAGILVVVGAVNALMTHWSNTIGASLVYTGIARIRLQLRERAEQAPPGLDSDMLGNVQQTVYRRLNSASNALMSGPVPFMSATLALMANATAVVVIAGKFSLLPLVTLIPFLVVAICIGHARTKAIAERSTANRFLTNVVQAVLGSAGLRRMHLHTAPYLVERYEKDVESVRDTSFRTERAASAMVMPLGMGTTVATASLLIVAAHVNMQSSVSTAILAALTQMSAALLQVARSWVRVQELRSPIENTLKALALPRLPAYEEPETTPRKCVSRLFSRRERKRLYSVWRSGLVSCFKKAWSGLKLRLRLLWISIRYWKNAEKRHHFKGVELQRRMVASRRRFLIRSLFAYRRKRKATKGKVCLKKAVSPPAIPSLRLENVSYTVQDTPSGVEATILQPCSQTLTGGNVYVVTGKTSHGKTTLAKMLVGLLTPTTGRVLINGQDMAGLGYDEIREQSIALFAPEFIKGSSVHDVLSTAMDGAANPELVERLLARVGLAGLDLALDPTKLKSPGTRQRLAAVEMALKRETNPHCRILVMDEHTSSLDPEARETVERLLAEYYHGCLVVIMASRKWEPVWSGHPPVIYLNLENGQLMPE